MFGIDVEGIKKEAAGVAKKLDKRLQEIEKKQDQIIKMLNEIKNNK